MSGPTSSSTRRRPSSTAPRWTPASRSPRRHIGPSADEQAKMLAVLGYRPLDELVDTAVPKTVHSDSPLALAAGRAEPEVLAELRELAGRNQVLTSMIGLGYSRHGHAAGDPAQRAGEPGLVHRLHALPAGDLARAGSRRCSTSRPWSPT